MIVYKSLAHCVNVSASA